MSDTPTEGMTSFERTFGLLMTSLFLIAGLGLLGIGAAEDRLLVVLAGVMTLSMIVWTPFRRVAKMGEMMDLERRLLGLLLTLMALLVLVLVARFSNEGEVPL